MPRAQPRLRLHAPDDLREPRTAHGPTRFAPLPADASVTRPAFNGLWFAAAGAFALLGLVPLISLARKPGRSTVTGWRAGIRLVDENNRPVAQTLLADGGIATVFPEGGQALPQSSAVLIRRRFALPRVLENLHARGLPGRALPSRFPPADLPVSSVDL